MTQHIDWERILPGCVQKQYSHLTMDSKPDAKQLWDIAEFWVVKGLDVEYRIRVDVNPGHQFEVGLWGNTRKPAIWYAITCTPQHVIQSVRCAAAIAIDEMGL